MSEFKFACPVCGQHMMCDVSQGGRVMECPTCFQKITAPQAPAADGKFILTGTKVSEKKISARGFDAAAPAAEKKFPVAILLGVIVLVLGAGAAVYFLHRKTAPPEISAPKNNLANPNPLPPPAPSSPPPVVPAASDANWKLTLAGVAIPATPVAGRIHGQNFKVERALFQNGTLILRAGTQGVVESGLFISFGGAQAGALAQKTINVRADTEKAAAVQLRWKDSAGVQRKAFNTGYALRLEFGALANNHLSGSIYLCTPDSEKSYLIGTFAAEVVSPKPKPTPPGQKKTK